MQKHLKRAILITDILENNFKIWKFKFGLDPILGLVPGLGDILAAALGLYLIWIAVKMNLPQAKIIRMIANITFDFLLGLIPVVGDVSDFVYKSNTRNLRLLRSFAEGKFGVVS